MRPTQPAQRRSGKNALSSLTDTGIGGLLTRARVARLATTGRQGRPYAVPVCFVYFDGFLYTPIDLKPKRLAATKLARVRNIRANARVALLVDHYEEDWTKLWFLLVHGKAKILGSGSRLERAAALQALRRKYPQYAAGMLGEDATLIQIAPDRITFWEAKG